MSEPLAYFLTFRCYGTWLHGDSRGSVDRGCNVPFSSVLPADTALEQEERQLLRHAPAVLDQRCRRIVTETIREVCVHRGWELHALNVRTNHVHVVLTGDRPPERVMNELKAWSTRRLREAGAIAADARLWTRHGSTRYVWNYRDVEAACQYVLEEQDHPSRPEAALPDGRGSERR